MISPQNESLIPVSLSWSGGKDSAYALWELSKSRIYQVVRLHTTFGEETRRVGLHGIHEDLIQLQADALELPLDRIYYPASGDNNAYTHAVNSYLHELQKQGIFDVAYGDIFLEDLKKFREELLAKRAMKGVFPLWGRNTEELANDFIRSAFVTLICAADENHVALEWMGKAYDKLFLQSLKSGVDPCGENGEFHTFCIAGPIFNTQLSITLGPVVRQSYQYNLADGTSVEKGFWFREILKAPI
jgi:uncharacterized protein (TIGR00290 family)